MILLKWSTRPTTQKIKFLSICEKVDLRFALIGSEVPFPHVRASEKHPKLCLDVYLSPIETLKALGIEISEAENINFMENWLYCTATSTPKNENGRYH
jgi:hypothetical protein